MKKNKNPMGDKPLRITHVFLNPFQFESRVIKEMHSVKKKYPNAFISFIGLREEELPSYEPFENEISIYRENIRTRFLPKTLFFQFIKYIEWTSRVLFRLKKIKPTHIHCHSLDALPASILGKFLLRNKLIYDAHELETQRHGLNGMKRKGAYILEKSLMRFVDDVIVVSPSIQKIYQTLYPKKKIQLLVNAPSKTELIPHSKIDLRKQIKISEDDFLFICIGGLSKGRGVGLCLDVFKKLSRPHHILFLGKGPLEQKIQYAAKHHDNIHLLPPVPPNEVIAVIKNADVLLRLFKTQHLNHIYALPNAIFQGEVAGIPYIVNKSCTDIVRFFSASPLCVPLEKDKETLYKWCLHYKRENFPKRTAPVDKSYIWETYEHVLFETYQY